MIFSFMLMIKLMQMRKEVDDKEYRFLLTGGVSLGEELPTNPDPTWISERQWGEIFRMSLLSSFKGFIEDFSKNKDIFKEMYDSTSP